MPNMSGSEKLSVEPISYSVKGIKMEDFLSKEFVAEMKKEFPSIVVDGIVLYIADSEKHVTLSPRSTHDGELVLEPIDVEGDDPKFTNGVLEVIKRVFH